MSAMRSSASRLAVVWGRGQGSQRRASARAATAAGTHEVPLLLLLLVLALHAGAVLHPEPRVLVDVRVAVGLVIRDFNVCARAKGGGA